MPLTRTHSVMWFGGALLAKDCIVHNDFGCSIPMAPRSSRHSTGRRGWGRQHPSARRGHHHLSQRRRKERRRACELRSGTTTAVLCHGSTVSLCWSVQNGNTRLIRQVTRDLFSLSVAACQSGATRLILTHRQRRQ